MEKLHLGDWNLDLTAKQVRSLQEILPALTKELELDSESEALFWLLNAGIDKLDLPHSPERLTEIRQMITDKAKGGELLRKEKQRKKIVLTPAHLTRARIFDVKTMKMLNGQGCADPPLPYYVIPASYPDIAGENSLKRAIEARELVKVTQGITLRLGMEFDPVLIVLWQFDIKLHAVGFNGSSVQEITQIMRDCGQQLGTRFVYRITGDFFEVLHPGSLRQRSIRDRFMSINQEEHYTDTERTIFARKRPPIKPLEDWEIRCLELSLSPKEAQDEEADMAQFEVLG